MNIVIDASVIIAVIANEPEKDMLVEMTRGTNLIAPHSVHWEIGNAFSAMLKRKRIMLESAVRAIEAYKKIQIEFIDVDLGKSLKIAHKLSIYAYDAYIMQCAISTKSPLISLDQNLITLAKQIPVKTLEVVK